MNKKINVAILFGGKSFEHEVSLQSGRCVSLALDKERYTIRYIGIDKKGNWDEYDPKATLMNTGDPTAICLGQKKAPFHPFNWEGIDIVFPIFHGPMGEDGTVQGVLRLADIPFVGADVLSSAIGMDKIISKKLVQDAGVAIAPWTLLQKGDPIESGDLRYPLFVKPNTGGSSVGISKIHKSSELEPAVKLAFRYSEIVLLEENLNGKEIQVAVIGDRNPKASLPCEIIPKGEFHTYESKYVDKEGAQFFYPAPLEVDETSLIQKTALMLYKALCCEGFGRVDLFLTKEGVVYFNEINTIPGLTVMSPFFKMWEASGVSPSAVVDQLIALGFERHERQKQLVTNHSGARLS